MSWLPEDRWCHILRPASPMGLFPAKALATESARCFGINTICSTKNRFFFMTRLALWVSLPVWSGFRQAHHAIEGERSMTPRLIRYAVALGCVGAAALLFWGIRETRTERSGASSGYTHLSGRSVGYTSDYGYRIAVVTPEKGFNAGQIVTVAHENGDDPGVDQPVDLYVDLMGLHPPRLGDTSRGGALPAQAQQSAHSPMLDQIEVAVLALALLGAASYLVLARLTVRGWNWSEPSPFADEPIVQFARWRRGNFVAPYVWASLGLIPWVIAGFEYRAHKTLPLAYADGLLLGLLWCLVLSIYAGHMKSYRAWAAGPGLRQDSVLGFLEIPWSQIAAIEDRTVRTFHWSHIGQQYSSAPLKQSDYPRRYVRFLDQTGRALADLSRDLEGQGKVVAECAERTGIAVAMRQISIVDFASWGATSRRPRDDQ